MRNGHFCKIQLPIDRKREVDLFCLLSRLLVLSLQPFTLCALCLTLVLLGSWKHLGLSFEKVFSTKTINVGCGVLLASFNISAFP